MSAFQEVIYTLFVFVMFLIVIPVGVFVADLVKNYIKKRRQNHEQTEVHHPL